MENVLSNKKSEFFKFLALGMFSLMLVAPFEFLVYKIIILFVLMVVSFFTFINASRTGISYEVFNWFKFYIVFGLLFTLVGLLNPEANKGYVLNSTTVTIIWPVFYFFLLNYFTSYINIKSVHKTIIYSCILIGLYLLFAGLSYLSIIPIDPSFFTLVKPVIGKYDTSVQLFIPSATTLLYVIPFLISYLFIQQYKHDNINKIHIIIALILGFIAIVVTARRALLLNVLVTPLLFYFVLKFGRVHLSKKQKFNLIFSFVFIVVLLMILIPILSYYEILNLNEFIQLFKNGFDFNSGGSDESTSIKAEQYSFLIRSWIDSPIIGSGFGTASKYVLRSEETPWVYELSYIAILFQTGIFGLIYYSLLIFWIIFKGIVLIRQGFTFILPHMIGCICFLIGNFSNPYLASFDHLWALFLPISLINYGIIQQNRGK